MPKVTIRCGAGAFTDELEVNSNLVVKAGIRKFPYPHLRYGCGMGKCAKCACKVLHSASPLLKPNWKEVKQLGPRIEQGYRLTCQLWIQDDIELQQDPVS